MKTVLKLKCLSGQESSDDWHWYRQDEDLNFVYVFYSGLGKVLYVGKTGNFTKRWQQHCYSEKDMDRVCYVEIMVYSTPAEAAFAEIQGILYYNPPWNKFPIKGKFSKKVMKPDDKILFEIDRRKVVVCNDIKPSPPQAHSASASQHT